MLRLLTRWRAPISSQSARCFASQSTVMQSPHGSIDRLLNNNKEWRDRMMKEDPKFFEQMAEKQSPEYLFIGCSDSRVSAELLTGLGPGELFVHRNIANMVVNTDFSCLSVLQFAVEVLKVKHVIVCGHYECGGVLRALSREPAGVIDNWLRHIQDVYRLHAAELDAIKDPAEKARRLVVLNTTEQVLNVFKTTFVQEARRRQGGYPQVHGLVYDLRDGRLEQLQIDVFGYLRKYQHIYTYQTNDFDRAPS